MPPTKSALCLLILLTSCSNFLHVNTFSANAASAVDKYNDIGFSAWGYCKDLFCVDPRTYIEGNIIATPGCDCKEFSAADHAILVINRLLADYLAGIQKITASSSGKLKFAGVAKATDALRENSKLGLSANEIKLARDLSTEVSNIVAGTYKKRQLRKILEASHDSFVVVIKAQRSNIKFLQSILLQEQNELRVVYASFSDKTKDASVRYLLNYQLKEKFRVLDEQNRKLGVYSSSLQKIEEGYLTLYAKRLSLKNPEFRKEILDEASQINEIAQDYNALN